MELSMLDSTTHANVDDFVIESSHFDWKLNFKKKNIHGHVTHTVRTINPQSNKLKLDVNKLDIDRVIVDNGAVQFRHVDDNLGGFLEVSVPENLVKFQVTIHYSTTNEGKALQWMAKEMTHGGGHPYLFSQCEAIHARSLFPCQDTPVVKATYTATIEAPSELEVLMSAIKEKVVTLEGVKHHSFRQKIPIPSYLVAIVCGDIVGRKVGPRSTVWSEPGLVDSAAWEFESLEELICHAEQLCGPFEWGICDLLILPPTFPYGGMENPCLIFVTPCLVSGDRSQVFVVAHEIAHNWTGNLVTNSGWDHFWVNEGHTNYLERLILERVQESEPYRHLHICIGLADLESSLDQIERTDGPNHEYMKLVPHLNGVDPDEAFSSVPYEKGSFLLFYLETIVGKDKMMRWLKSYIANYRLKSLDTDEWKRFFIEYMTTTEGVNPSVLDKVEWNRWFYEAGRLPIDPYSLLDRRLIVECTELARLWINYDPVSSNENDLLIRFRSLLPDQQWYFLQVIVDIERAVLPESVLALMGNLYGLTTSHQSELLIGWSILCLRSRYRDAVDQVFEFLNSQGRLKYNRPIYRELFDWPETRQKARDNFEQRTLQMHPTTRDEIRRILYPPSS